MFFSIYGLLGNRYFDYIFIRHYRTRIYLFSVLEGLGNEECI